MKRVFPRQTPEQKERLKALIATSSPSPSQLSELAQAEFWWRVVPGRMDGYSFYVVAPFQNTLNQLDYHIRNAVKAEFDPYGDGKFERILDGKRSFTFERPGEYRPTLRIYDANGLLYTQRTIVTVLSREAFDARMQAIWNDMNEALKRNNIAAALECVHTNSRPRYYEMMHATPELARNANNLVGPINWVTNENQGSVTYSQTVIEEGIKKTRNVQFIIDVDGVWRVR